MRKPHTQPYYFTTTLCRLWLIAALFFLLLFSGTECRKNPIVPQIDTTSQNFSVLRVDTLGSIFSFANCVDIVNENDIWVGGIFTWLDDTGETHYDKNLAHWNGEHWELMSVPMYGYNNTGPTPEELVAVKVFSNTDIFVTSKFNSQARWDGTKWTSYFVDPQVGYLQHVWARTSNDIYFVGEAGRAAYYNGQTFTKINTGITNPPLTDVWGDENAVYAVGYGSSPTEGNETVSLTGNKTSWSIVNRYDITDRDSILPSQYQYVGPMYSVFRAHSNSKLWFLGGRGVWNQLYEIESLSPFRAKVFFDFPTNYGAYLVRGTSDNDLYVVNQRNAAFYHFNGITWYKYEPPMNNYLLAYSTASFLVKGNTWVAVGFSTESVVGSAIVVIGKHN